MDRLLERAFLYRFLSLAFSYPTEEILSALLSSLKDLEKCLSSLSLNYDLQILRKEITKALHNPTEIQGEYTTLFETDPRAPIRETSYELDKTGRRSAEMADLLGFYRAFGLNLSEGIEPDSIVTELEFMSYLLQKIYHLREAGEEEGAEITSEAVDKFLGGHLGRWYEVLCRSVVDSKVSSFYSHISDLLKNFLDMETRKVKVTHRLSTHIPETIEDGSSFKCGF